jgi:hypothetical protein
VKLIDSPGFLASYWAAGFWDISSGIRPCFPLAEELCKFYARNDNKQLTLLIQRKLAITGRKTLFQVKIYGSTKKIKKMAPTSF